MVPLDFTENVAWEKRALDSRDSVSPPAANFVQWKKLVEAL
jgi:hypothetical protein